MTHDNNIGATTVAIGKALDFSEEYTPAHEWEKIKEDQWHETWRHKEHGERLINKELLNFILDQHSARLVERTKKGEDLLYECIGLISMVAGEQSQNWTDEMYRLRERARKYIADQAIDIVNNKDKV